MLHSQDGGNVKTETVQSTGSAIPSLGFGGTGLLTKQSGTDELEVLKGIKKVLTDNGKTDTELNLFLRDTFTELAYSTITLSQTKAGITMFFVILMEASGEHGITTAQYLETLANKRVPFVTTDAIDGVLNDVIVEALGTPVDNTFQIGGLVVPAGTEYTEELVKLITMESNNALEVEINLRAGTVSDLNLKSETGSMNGFLSMSYNTLTAPHIDIVGRQTPVAWNVDLRTELFGDKNQISPNQQGSGKMITSVKGRLNFLPEEYTESIIGRAPETKVGFHPQVIVTNIGSAVPTLSYALVALATSAVVAKDDNWIKPVLDGATNNIGELNRMLNIGNEKTAKPIDINGAKKSMEEKAGMIKAMASLEPIISMDAVAFGENSAQMSTFTAAAQGDSGACREIIDTLHHVSGGEFPSNYPVNEIFAGEMVVIPSGPWSDNNGINRSIDDVDTPFVLSLGQNANDLIRAYLYGELGQTPDAFVDRCELLRTIEINAVIEARKMRMTFSSRFIDEMLHALGRAGLTPRFESVGILSKPTGLGFTSGIFAAAALGGVSAFQAYQPNTGFTDPYRYGMNFRR